VFCPRCKDEFREGFTRCASCDVDLVHDLSAPDRQPVSENRPAATIATAMIEYCGFLELDEARRARESLKAEQIVSDIVIRESEQAREENPLGEEYWLRVEADKFRMAAPVLGFDVAESPESESGLACSRCGDVAAAESTYCLKCGSRFEEP